MIVCEDFFIKNLSFLASGLKIHQLRNFHRLGAFESRWFSRLCSLPGSCLFLCSSCCMPAQFASVPAGFTSSCSLWATWPSAAFRSCHTASGLYGLRLHFVHVKLSTASDSLKYAAASKFFALKTNRTLLHSSS